MTLSAAYSANATSANQVFDMSGRAWNAGAQVTVPLVEGGTLWFNRKAALESYAQAMALYRDTVLGAFRQVADTLQALALRYQDTVALYVALGGGWWTPPRRVRGE